MFLNIYVPIDITEDRTDLKFGIPTTDSRVGKVQQGYAQGFVS